MKLKTVQEKISNNYIHNHCDILYCQLRSNSTWQLKIEDSTAP